MVDAESGQCFSNNLLAAFCGRNVGLHHDGAVLASNSIDFLTDNFCAGSRGVGYIVDDNASSGFGKSQGDASTNAVFSTGAGDDGDFACERKTVDGHFE